MLMMMLQVALAASADELARAARSGDDPVVQGEAILALSQSDDPEAARALDQLYDAQEVSPLIRTWAGAARIQQATSAAEVLRYADHLSQLPALTRPLQLRLAVLPADSISVAQGLTLMTNPDLAEIIVPSILAQPAEDLVAAMLTHHNVNTRRIAAGLLAAPEVVGAEAAVIEALTWREQEALPWGDGALFIPGRAWSATEALALVEALIGWHVYCHRTGQTDALQQINNNLRSVELLRAAGLPRRAASTSRDWLVLLGRAHGQVAVDRVLAPQGMERQYAVTPE